MTVEFTLNGQSFTALNGGPQYTFSPAVSIMVEAADQAEVDYFWDRLTEGGEEVACGWVTDKYGLSWQIVPRRLLRHDARPGPGHGCSRHRRHAPHEEVRHRQTGARLRRSVGGSP